MTPDPGGAAAAHPPTANGRPAVSPLRVALDYRIPSDVRYIEPVVTQVQEQCRQGGLPPRKCSLNVPVALSEALSNAILRGNREDPSKDVRVHVELDQQALVLEVADQGPGFSIEASFRDATDPANLTDENGRGLFLMRRLMDSVERYSDGGNVVRLTLRR